MTPAVGKLLSAQFTMPSRLPPSEVPISESDIHQFTSFRAPGRNENDGYASIQCHSYLSIGCRAAILNLIWQTVQHLERQYPTPFDYLLAI